MSQCLHLSPRLITWFVNGIAQHSAAMRHVWPYAEAFRSLSGSDGVSREIIYNGKYSLTSIFIDGAMCCFGEHAVEASSSVTRSPWMPDNLIWILDRNNRPDLSFPLFKKSFIPSAVKILNGVTMQGFYKVGFSELALYHFILFSRIAEIIVVVCVASLVFMDLMVLCLF